MNKKKFLHRAAVWRFFSMLLAMTMSLAAGSTQAQSEAVADSIVKIISTHNHPDFASPWQRRDIHTVTGSGVIIAGNRILTNAHVVADQTLVEVQREGSGISYNAQVAYVCHSCDLAILTVEDNSFFKDVKPLEIDGLPQLRSKVNVYGFPTGGETISITEGIVSRIEVDYYVHSSDRYLLVQVDAAINPGNSGGPAISNGKIIGIAMQALENAENIGYIVPAPIIMHFLQDIEDQRFDGFPELDIYVQLLQNPALRNLLRIPPDTGGLLVTGVARDSSAVGILKPGDVLLDIDGYSIDRDGKVTLEDGLRVESIHLEYLKQVGSKLEVRILRAGKESVLQLPLTARKRRTSNLQFDRIPTYFVFAGVVFQPLTGDYLKSHHESQFSLLSYIPEYTLEGYEKQIPDRIAYNRKQTIVISRVLPDTINQGYKDMEGAVIYSVDDTPVRDMRHLIELVQHPRGKYIKFVTDFGSLMVFDLNATKLRNEKILKNYQIYNDRSPDLTDPTTPER